MGLLDPLDVPLLRRQGLTRRECRGQHPQRREAPAHFLRGSPGSLAAPFHVRGLEGWLQERRDREDVQNLRPVRNRFEQMRRRRGPARQRDGWLDWQGQQLLFVSCDRAQEKVSGHVRRDSQSSYCHFYCERARGTCRLERLCLSSCKKLSM